MLLEVALVRVLARVLFSAEEEHVLEKVREARKLLRVARRADVHVGARGSVVALRIGDEHQLQVVGELQVAVLALVEVGLVNLVGLVGDEPGEVDFGLRLGRSVHEARRGHGEEAV